MKISAFKEHKSKEKFTSKQTYEFTGDDYWNWSIWVESSEIGLDEIDNVIYNLHYTFRDPVRIINTRENKFRLDTSGWGTFVIYIIINFKDESTQELEHELVLNYPPTGTEEE